VAGGAVRLVPAVRVLDTATGRGLTEACRLSAPRWSGDRTEVPVRVTGVGQVPATGVAAVVLRVQALRGSAPRSTVTVRATPSTRAVTVVTRRATEAVAGTVTTPISADGTVRIGLDAGTADVRVDVLGWAPTVSSALRSGSAGLKVIRPVVAHDAWAAPLAGREARSVPLAGVPTSGVTGLVVTVETAATTKAAAVDILGPAESTPSGRVTASPDGVRRVTALVPTSNGRIVVRNASSAPVPFRVRVVGWLGASASTPLVALVAPKVVVDTQAGVGLTGTTPTRVGRSFALSTLAGLPSGASAALVSLGVRAGGTAGTAILTSRWRGHAVDSERGTWVQSMALIPLAADGSARLRLPAGAHGRVTVLAYVG
jgi:hypothetical protein